MTECDQAQLLPTSSLFNYGAWQGDIRQFETLSTYHTKYINMNKQKTIIKYLKTCSTNFDLVFE